MQTKQPEPPALTEHADDDEPTLNDSIRDYVRTYALWHGRPQSARHFDVSRHILWRFLERGNLGRSLPGVVIKTVGDYPVVVAAAARIEYATADEPMLNDVIRYYARTYASGTAGPRPCNASASPAPLPARSGDQDRRRRPGRTPRGSCEPRR